MSRTFRSQSNLEHRHQTRKPPPPMDYTKILAKKAPTTLPQTDAAPHQTPKARPVGHPTSSNRTAAVTLSKATEASLQKALNRALAASTTRMYQQGIKSFHLFCNSEKISYKDRLPASETLLAAFAAHRVGTASGSAICKSISALHSWHTNNGAQWQGGDLLTRVLRGAENLAPQASH
ncbi:hypothetical protein FRC02_000230 [Tulasnella sp. 418]|nr:hypothetical protein FRC02_000230 [Tulasnella sp. 418]